MKNVNESIVSFQSDKNSKFEKKDKYKRALQRFDSLNSFKVVKQSKMNEQFSSSKKIGHFRKNTLFFSNKKTRRNIINTRPKISEEEELIIINEKPNQLIALKPMKSLIQYARCKIKKEYMSPYIERIAKFNKNSNNQKKIEEKLKYLNLYKINEIFQNKKSRLNINFLESILYLIDNEYLIKQFKKKEIRIIFRYLLGFIYFKDISSQSLNGIYIHNNRKVQDEFNYYINNNYRLIELSANNSSINQKNNHSSFLFQNNLILLSLNRQKYKIIYPFFKSPNYFLIKDMPHKLIPNVIPNYFFKGSIIHILMKKYAFFTKFNFNAELIRKKNEIFDKSRSEMNSSFIAQSKSNWINDNITENSSSIEKSFLYSNNPINDISGNNKMKYLNTKLNEIEGINILIKQLNKKEEKRIHFYSEELLNRRKKKKSSRKKKIKKQPYQNYEIIQTDDFIIKKSEKSNILKMITDEMLNLTYIQLRNKRKLGTRLLSIKPNRNNEKRQTSSNEKFKRKNKFFLTNANKNFLINNEYSILNKNRKGFFGLFKNYLFNKDYNDLNLNSINNSKKFKVFNNLVKQKKISFTIISKLNKIKFKDTTQFISKVNRSIKDEIASRKLIKGIIIGYQNNHNERKTNSLHFPEINKFSINISNIKKIKNKKSKTNRSFNYRYFFTLQNSKLKDTININDIIKFKKIQI